MAETITYDDKPVIDETLTSLINPDPDEIKFVLIVLFEINCDEIKVVLIVLVVMSCDEIVLAAILLTLILPVLMFVVETDVSLLPFTSIIKGVVAAIWNI